MCTFIVEYEIDNKSKYTILHIRTMLVCKKKGKKSKKETQTQIPPGGMVNRLERAYSKGDFFLLAVIYNIRKLKLMHFGPCDLESKGLQQACNKLELKHSGGGSFREAPVQPRVGNWAETPSIFVRTDKKNEKSK